MILPVRINSKLRQPKDVGRTLVLEFTATQTTINHKGILANQSTSALVPHEDKFVDITNLVTVDAPWTINPVEVKHFLMIQGPLHYTLELTDPSGENTIVMGVKRMYSFAGTFNGSIVVRSQESQSIKLTYA
jgi:hypothetical protein